LWQNEQRRLSSDPERVFTMYSCLP